MQKNGYLSLVVQWMLLCKGITTSPVVQKMLLCKRCCAKDVVVQKNGYLSCCAEDVVVQKNGYRVAKNHRMAYLYRSFSAKEPYD